MSQVLSIAQHFLEVSLLGHCEATGGTMTDARWPETTWSARGALGPHIAGNSNGHPCSVVMEPDDSVPGSSQWRKVKPSEFVREAFHIGRPVEVNALFPDCIRKLVDATQALSHEALARTRAAELRRWAMLAEVLKPKEYELKSVMSERITKVLENKKICLFEQLIAHAGHQDSTLASDLAAGFDLTGELPKSRVFKNNFRPAKILCENLEP